MTPNQIQRALKLHVKDTAPYEDNAVRIICFILFFIVPAILVFSVASHPVLLLGCIIWELAIAFAIMELVIKPKLEYGNYRTLAEICQRWLGILLLTIIGFHLLLVLRNPNLGILQPILEVINAMIPRQETSILEYNDITHQLIRFISAIICFSSAGLIWLSGKSNIEKLLKQTQILGHTREELFE